jgi:hypothetical protein
MSSLEESDDTFLYLGSFIFCVYLWETRKVMRVVFDGKARKWMW